MTFVPAGGCIMHGASHMQASMQLLSQWSTEDEKRHLLCQHG